MDPAAHPNLHGLEEAITLCFPDERVVVHDGLPQLGSACFSWTSVFVGADPNLGPSPRLRPRFPELSANTRSCSKWQMMADSEFDCWMQVCQLKTQVALPLAAGGGEPPSLAGSLGGTRATAWDST